MDNSDDYTVYENMRKCAFDYRHMREEDVTLAPREFNTQLSSAGYVSFRTSRKGHRYLPDSECIWVIMSDSAAAAKESKAFNTMWSIISPGEDTNVIIVTTNPFRSNIQSVVNSKRAESPSLYIECVTKEMFSFEIPKHCATCPHEIVDPAELDEYLERTCTDPIFKNIAANDPQIVWIGARPGNVVKIDMVSYSACKAVDYRIVVIR